MLHLFKWKQSTFFSINHFFFHCDVTWKFPTMTISKTNVLVSCGGSAQEILYRTSSFAQQEGRREKKNEV